ncbi:MAG TPA: phosphatase [Polyangia bacterium]|nr:phosphatase [Polyangia bacterium]
MTCKRALSYASLLLMGGCTNAVTGGGTTATDQPAAVAFESAAQLVGKLNITPVPTAQGKKPGFSSPNLLPPELIETAVAQGSIPLENPQTVTLADGTTAVAAFYGYNGDGPLLPAPGDLPSATHLIEATKTEPDKNTYLVLYGQNGPDASYDYGTHFLFQGHEGGTPGMITRINLDADGAHKVTLMAATDNTGAALADIDGSTWDPFAQRLIFTTEDAGAPTYQATLSYPSVVEDISGSIGRGGYEGVQNDGEGNLWIVEDNSGATTPATPHAKAPAGFIYRFVPRRAEDLKHGKLQVLQVTSLQDGQPIVEHDPATDTLSADQADLHTYGKTFKTRWITIHDTAHDGNATPFSANDLAKAKGGTPFKRPENGQFRPGSNFREFVFATTGDTSALTEAGSAFGGFGAVFKVTQHAPGGDTGTLTLVYRGDVAHTGFDNCSFISKNDIVFVEDGGDTLHAQRNALDSAYVIDLTADYADPANVPARLIAEGRDPSATLDSALGAFAGFQNEGDNEITGFHVSNGDPSPRGLLGASIPRPFKDGWRIFWTQQHGENQTWEILPNSASGCSPFGDD